MMELAETALRASPHLEIPLETVVGEKHTAKPLNFRAQKSTPQARPTVFKWFLLNTNTVVFFLTNTGFVNTHPPHLGNSQKSLSGLNVFLQGCKVAPPKQKSSFGALTPSYKDSLRRRSPHRKTRLGALVRMHQQNSSGGSRWGSRMSPQVTSQINPEAGLHTIKWWAIREAESVSRLCSTI